MPLVIAVLMITLVATKAESHNMGAVCFGYMMDITTLIASLLTYHYRHKCSGS